MNEHPIIKVKRGKVQRKNTIWKKKEALKIIEELSTKYEIVYAIDLDGYKKNSPNLDLYKKIKGRVWIDACPRYVEDVIDLMISGSERVTIWNMNDNYLRTIQDICEGEIFIGDDDIKTAVNKIKKYGFSGLVLGDNQDGKTDIESWKIHQNEEIIKKVG